LTELFTLRFDLDARVSGVLHEYSLNVHKPLELIFLLATYEEMMGYIAFNQLTVPFR
jgi:hypothetical protein